MPEIGPKRDEGDEYKKFCCIIMTQIAPKWLHMKKPFEKIIYENEKDLRFCLRDWNFFVLAYPFVSLKCKKTSSIALWHQESFAGINAFSSKHGAVLAAYYKAHWLRSSSSFVVPSPKSKHVKNTSQATQRTSVQFRTDFSSIKRADLFFRHFFFSEKSRLLQDTKVSTMILCS